MDKRFYVDESRPWFTKEAGWPDEVPKNIEFPDISLGDMLRESARRYSDYRVIYFLKKSITYRELDEYVDRVASAFVRLGLKKGDVIALMLPNSIQYVICYYATVRIGAIVSGINPTYKPAEVLHQLKTIGARALVVLDSLYESTIAPIIDKTDVKILIGTNIADFLDLGFIKEFLGKLLNKIPSGRLPSGTLMLRSLAKHSINLPEVKIEPDDPATYIMTGGTTGVPKAAVLTHRNLVANALQSKAWLYKSRPGVGVIGIIPLFHSFAMTCVMNISISNGGWMLLYPRPPKTDDMLVDIENLATEEGLMYVGAEILFKRLAEYPDIAKYNLGGKLSLCVSGAGPLHRPVQEAFERSTGARLVEGYGLTEASPVVSAGPFWGNRKIGSIGLPFPGTDWKIVDPLDPSKEMPTGEIGELAVAGPQVMAGYLNRPDETRETIVEMNGKRWLLTGDLGFMDEGGSVFLRDRKKQLIKHRGYSVFPKEVEELISNNEHVSEVAVAGIPDDAEGEVIKAWVVLKPESKGKISEDELLKWCRENMTHYKVPKYIEFRDDLPKTLVGKVLRRELQENDPLYKKIMESRKAKDAE